jgi:hypothetical protein
MSIRVGEAGNNGLDIPNQLVTIETLRAESKVFKASDDSNCFIRQDQYSIFPACFTRNRCLSVTLRAEDAVLTRPFILRQGMGGNMGNRGMGSGGTITFCIINNK